MSVVLVPARCAVGVIVVLFEGAATFGEALNPAASRPLPPGDADRITY